MIVFAIFRKGLLTSATLLKSLDGCGREGGGGGGGGGTNVVS